METELCNQKIIMYSHPISSNEKNLFHEVNHPFHEIDLNCQNSFGVVWVPGTSNTSVIFTPFIVIYL